MYWMKVLVAIIHLVHHHNYGYLANGMRGLLVFEVRSTRAPLYIDPLLLHRQQLWDNDKYHYRVSKCDLDRPILRSCGMLINLLLQVYEFPKIFRVFDFFKGICWGREVRRGSDMVDCWRLGQGHHQIERYCLVPKKQNNAHWEVQWRTMEVGILFSVIG